MKRTKIKNAKNETLKAGCVVVNDRHEVLLVADKRRRTWAFPKGHAEPGETAKQVALREVKEETGYSVEIIRKLPAVKFTYRQTGERARMALFLAKPLGLPEKPEKGAEARWFPIQKARKIVYRDLVFLLDQLAG